MFYGGFNTKWSATKPVAGKAITLSTMGVIITAGVTTVLCSPILGMSWRESFLVGAVLSPTDAASVFSILRKKKLSLKDGTASILEVESGSNDPIAYMLTIIAISLMGTTESQNVAVMIFLQTVIGVFIGIVVSVVSIRITTKTNIVSDGLDTIFMIARVLICFGISAVLRGNPYLSLYLLSYPHQMPKIIPTALIIVIILTLVARPIAVYILMMPCKCKMRQCLLISWAGLRGASSSVFAIMAVASGISMKQDLFHIVFTVTLFSVTIQGGLLPYMANKLKLVDDNGDVIKTFNDYQEEISLQLMRMYISKEHAWANKEVKEVSMPNGSLAIMIKRDDETIITKGDTLILPGDTLILSVPSYVH